jgi:hypothetical protein
VTGVIMRIPKIILSEQGGGGYGLDLSDAEKRSVIGCGQPGNEISLSTKGVESSRQHWHLKKLWPKEVISFAIQDKQRAGTEICSFINEAEKAQSVQRLGNGMHNRGFGVTFVAGKKTFLCCTVSIQFLWHTQPRIHRRSRLSPKR